jgi:hypothetical protein
MKEFYQRRSNNKKFLGVKINFLKDLKRRKFRKRNKLKSEGKLPINTKVIRKESGKKIRIKLISTLSCKIDKN